MKIKEYIFDWYDKFGIKLIESKKNHEGYGGKKFVNMPEYTFYVVLVENWTCDNHTVDRNIPDLLRLLEKIHFLESGNLPECLKILERREGGGLNCVYVERVLCEIAKNYNEDVIDAKIMLKTKTAIEEDRSPIFQRRIAWELSECPEEQKPCIYGRFTTGII